MPDTTSIPKWVSAANASPTQARPTDAIETLVRLATDKLAALLLLPPAALLVAVFALLIRRASPGPAFYHESRVGKGGRLFTITKLRTMHRDGEALLHDLLRTSAAARAEWATYHKLRKDPRIAGPAARLARKWSVDEIPQLLSVLKGDMHLVGPRPVEPAVRVYFSAELWERRLQCRPGLTGLWQLYGRPYGMRTMQRFDRVYLQRRSLRLDLLIALRTPHRLLASRLRV